jgi:DNA-binding transcriptional LysR family regulator
MRLLLRSTHGLMPTTARSFYERAKRSIGEADEAELAAQRLSRPPPAASDARHAVIFGSIETSTQKTVRILYFRYEP